jgi:ABC-type Fe3+/spermidine/putrescine transport system ATPase subunit
VARVRRHGFHAPAGFGRCRAGFEEGGRASALRPEKVRLTTPEAARATGSIETANFLGGSTLYRIRLDSGQSLLARETHAGERAPRSAGDTVGMAWNDLDTVILEA